MRAAAVAMITSAENAAWPGDVTLPMGKYGLDAPSIIRPAKIATMEAGRIIRVLGRLDARLRKQARAAIEAALD